MITTQLHNFCENIKATICCLCRCKTDATFVDIKNLLRSSACTVNKLHILIFSNSCLTKHARMPSCSAYRCRNRSEDAKKKGLTFHRFPASDPKRLRQWVINMKWDKWMPSKRSLLCSSHFQEDCFDRSGLTVRLTPSAVPTIFSFPAHLQKKSLGRKPPKRPVITATPTMSLKSPSIGTVSGTTVSTIFRKMVISEHNYAVLESSRQLKQKLDVLNEQLDIYQKKLSNERKESARLKKKACHLASVVAGLRKRRKQRILHQTAIAD